MVAFVRMKSISVGYRVPKSTLEHYGISSLIVRAQATNPFLIYADSKLNGQDPDVLQVWGRYHCLPQNNTPYHSK